MSSLVIAAFVLVFLAEDMGAGAAPGVVVWATVPMIGVWAAGEVAVRALMRRVDRTGDPGLIIWGERVVFLQRLAGGAWHAFCVLGLGLLGGVRALVGDLILIDEALTALPQVALIVAGVWTQYPVDRRVRESLIMRHLDSGGVFPELVTRRRFVSLGVRHQVLFTGAPMVVILGWIEIVRRAWGWFGWSPNEVYESAAHFGGAVVVLALMPALLKRIWRTMPLHEGELRDRLVALGRAHGVRIRDVLMWDTALTQVNGAVMGVVARFRYVLLTDAMLASLDARAVEAVMAHEVAHVKHRHMHWMALAVIAAVLVIGTPLGWGVSVVLAASPWMPGWGAAVGDGVVLAATLAGALVVLGFVSRRFEVQADAYAIKHLSGWRPGGGEDGAVVTDDAARVMVGALRRVAALNGIPPARFGWRHGSILTRQRALIDAVGVPTDRVRADGVARRVKAFTALGAAAGFALLAADLALGWSGG